MRGLALRGWPGAVVLLLAGALTFANVFGNSWHYDDVHAITENPHLRSLAEPWRFFTDPTLFSRDADKAMFRPLLLTTFAVNYALSELDTSSWHVVNLALHLACAVVLWRILLALGRPAPVAFAGALFFLLHPLATEPVNYISSRSESLAALFVLGAFAGHLRLRRTGEVAWRLLSVLCLALGVLTKSVAITAVALLVLHDVLRDGWRPALAPRRWWPHAVVAAGYLAIVGAHVSRAVVSDAVRGPLEQLATQAKAAPYYLKLLSFPIGLNVHHQFFAGGSAVVVLPALLLAASLAFWVIRGASRDVQLGLGWGVLVLAPTIVVPLHVLVNDHRLYLPLAGAVVALTALHRRAPALPVVLAALVLLAVTSHQRNEVWESEYTLWSDAAAKSPNPLVPVAYVHLGNYAKDAGRPAEAVTYFERALEIAPEHVAARNNMGIALQRLGRLDEAIGQYEKVLAEDPSVDEAWYNLGKAYQERARQAQGEAALRSLGQARGAYARVSVESFHYPTVLNNVGTVFEFAGAPDSAAHYYRRSHELRRGGDAARNLQRLSAELPARAQALLAEGRAATAAGLCAELLAVTDAAVAPARREALLFLAAARLYEGRRQESLQVNRQLLREHPDFAEGYLQLGNLFETTGRPDEAAAAYRDLLQRQAAGPLAAEARRRLTLLEGAP